MGSTAQVSPNEDDSSKCTGEVELQPVIEPLDEVPATPATKPPLSLKEKINATMEDPGYSQLAKSISISMMAVIVFSTACFILESEVCQEASCNNTTGILEFDPAAFFFYYAEWISVLVFTIDYILRITTCPAPISFFFGIMNLIDLVAFLPFWIIGFMDSPAFAQPSLDSAGAVGGVGFVRAIRLIRVFRVFKVGKYSLGIQMFGGAIKHSVQPMGVLVLVLVVSMIIFSSVIWLIERPGSNLVTDELLSATGMTDMQPICFGTIPSAFWWALTTMTTVGYGDCYPITLLGKMVAVAAMVGGIVVLALPITVLGSNFQKMVEMYEEDASAIALEDMRGDGFVDELELREFLLSKKRDNLVRRDRDIRVKVLMAKYDQGGKGKLSLEEFTQMRQDILLNGAYDPYTEMCHLKVKVDSQSERLQRLEEKLDAMMSLLQSR